MPDKKTLEDIFNDDPFGLLNIKPATSQTRNEDERLVASFQEINDFYEKNKREPEQGADIHEHQLYSRLKSIRQDPVKMEMLKNHNQFGLLNYEEKKIESLDDILNDNTYGLLDDNSEGLFEYRNIKKEEERASADFVAKRKPCKDFKEYEPVFKQVQQDLATGKRKLISFKQDILNAGDFFVHNGVLLWLEKVEFEEEVQEFKSGSRYRKDGRTRVIFENGTESNMLYRSLYKSLLANGKAVSDNVDIVNEEFKKKFGTITDEDEEAGFIYILKSKSDKPEIKEINNLYKIGFSTIPVEERIKNASQEPTYLMAEVQIVTAYKCYNMNTQKLELLLHTFFGSSCLSIDVYDKSGGRHIPREWFIAPLDIIEQAIQMIITGEIVNYRYDGEKTEIVIR
jgi:hypothetical protein